MITDLETLLDQSTFQELVKAINENRDYEYSQNGLKIQAKSSDNGLSIQVQYEQNEEEQANKEAIDFSNYLQQIDNELFVELCEYIGREGLQTINNCLNSGKVESVRSAVLAFKSHLKNFLGKKIEYYQSCWNTLLR